MGTPNVETKRREALSPAELARSVEELRLLKTRAFNLEVAKIEAQQQASGGKAGDRRLLEAEQEQARQMLDTKYQKIERILQALISFLKDIAPKKELEAKLAAESERLKKLDEEIKIQRKVIDHEQESMDKEKAELQERQAAFREDSNRLQQQLQKLDVVNRAKELDVRQKELEDKLAAYKEEISTLTRQRGELNRDFDQLGQQRAGLDREAEALKIARESLFQEKSAMADAVAKEMAATFEAFVRDMLKENQETPAPPEKKDDDEVTWS